MFLMKFVVWVFFPQNLGVFQQPSEFFSNYWLGALLQTAVVDWNLWEKVL
jgi:hypothetical protein